MNSTCNLIETNLRPLQNCSKQILNHVSNNNTRTMLEEEVIV